MSENENRPQGEPDPVVPDAVDPAWAVNEPAPAVPAAAAAAAPAAPQTRFRDRMFGFRAVAAVTLAGVVVGGAGGVGLGFLMDDEKGSRDFMRGPMIQMVPPGTDGSFGYGAPGTDGNQLPPPGMEGQLPPGLPQDEDDDSGSGTNS